MFTKITMMCIVYILYMGSVLVVLTTGQDILDRQTCTAKSCDQRALLQRLENLEKLVTEMKKSSVDEQANDLSNRVGRLEELVIKQTVEIEHLKTQEKRLLKLLNETVEPANDLSNRVGRLEELVIKQTVEIEHLKTQEERLLKLLNETVKYLENLVTWSMTQTTQTMPQQPTETYKTALQTRPVMQSTTKPVLASTKDTETTKMTSQTTTRTTTTKAPVIDCDTEQVTGHAGKCFWIAFPTVYRYSYRNDIIVMLGVISNKTTSAAIRTWSNVSHHQIGPGTKLFITLPNTLIQNYNTIEQKGVFVTTNGSAYVLTYSFYKHSSRYTYMSWVPPYESLGVSYIAISYNPWTSSYYSYVSIVAPYAHTSVNISLKTNGTVSYNGVTYRNGAKLSLSLKRNDSFLLSSTHDITGSRIDSDQPIALQSGVERFAIQEHDDGCLTAASIYLPPVPSWGRTFIVPAIQTAVRYIIRIVPSQQETEVKVTNITGGTSSHTLSSMLELNFQASEMVVVKCYKPCFVAQYPASEGGSNLPVTSYMAAVPAVEQYSHDYHMVSPIIYGYKHFLSIMTQSGEYSGLLLNGTTISKFETSVQNMYTVSTGMTWSLLTVTVHAGTHSLTHTSPQTKYGVIAYGFGRCMSYGYVAGLDI